VFVALTIRAAEEPFSIEEGLAVMLTVGAAGGNTVTVVEEEAVPPAPVAVAV
jgi:hypothetical protein